MDRYLGRFSNEIYAATRIVVGFMFALHGAQKILGILGGFGGEAGATAPLFSQMWIGGMVELVGGLMVMVGFFTSWAAFVCSGMMAVAYFQFHQPNGLLPIQNRGDAAVLNCFIFLLIAARGSGMWSVSGRSEADG